MKLDAMSTLVQGLGRQAAKVDKAARDIQAAAVAQQNAVSAAQVRPADVRSDVQDVVAVRRPAAEDVEAVTAANTRAAAVASDGDFVKPLVDLLDARTAYKATAAAIKVTADIDQTVSDLMGKRTDT